VKKTPRKDNLPFSHSETPVTEVSLHTALFLKLSHKHLPVGLSFGWCGIGWGVEYLVRKGFVEDDDNEERNKILSIK